MSSFPIGKEVVYQPSRALGRVTRHLPEGGWTLITSFPDKEGDPEVTRWALDDELLLVSDHDKEIQAKRTPVNSEGKRDKRGDTRPTDQAEGLLRTVSQKTRPMLGRYAVATTSIKPGVELLRVRPVAAIVPDQFLEKKVCWHCFDSPESFTSCPACKVARFCDQDCRSAAERTHRWTCKAFMSIIRRDPPVSHPENVRLVIDALARRKAGLVADDLWDRFLSLEVGNPNKDDMSEARHAEQDIRNTVSADLVGEYTEKDIAMAFIRVKRNCHTLPIYKTFQTYRVMGLYPEAATMNHSCSPNAAAQAVLDEGPPTMTLRSVNDIAEGEEVSYSYLQVQILPQYRKERQELLRAVWGFDCCCWRCEQEGRSNSPLYDLSSEAERKAYWCYKKLENIFLVKQTMNGPFAVDTGVLRLAFDVIDPSNQARRQPVSSWLIAGTAQLVLLSAKQLEGDEQSWAYYHGIRAMTHVLEEIVPSSYEASAQWYQLSSVATKMSAQKRESGCREEARMWRKIARDSIASARKGFGIVLGPDHPLVKRMIKL